MYATTFPFNPERAVIPVKTLPKTRPRRDVHLVHGAEARTVLQSALLPVFTPRKLYNDVKPPDTIYYRIYRQNGEYAVFLLYEWPYQTLPPHKYDYEPVIVLMDKNMNIREVYTDGFHYYIQKYTAPPLSKYNPHIEITAPWRSMVVKWSEPSDNDVMIYPADEEKGTIGETKVKYLSDKVLSELRNRDVNPLAVNDKLIKNPWSVKQAKHWETFSKPTPDELLKDLAKNYGIKKYEVILTRLKLVVSSMIDKIKAFLQGTKEELKEKIESTIEKNEQNLLV